MVEPQTRDLRGRRISVPGGTIHHWRGTVFIANTDLEQVLESVRNPDQAEPLQEDVLEDRVLERGESALRVYLKLIRRMAAFWSNANLLRSVDVIQRS